MKSIQYLVTAILMVSTGLSAVEPAQNNALVPAKVQAVKNAGSMEAYLMAQSVKVPNKNGELEVKQLPLNVAQQIADYAGVERQQAKEIEVQYNTHPSKYTWKPFATGIASMPVLAAAALTANSKLWLAGSALLTSGLIWHSQADSKHNCHCTYAENCRHIRKNSIGSNFLLGMCGSFVGLPASCLLYPAAVTCMVLDEIVGKERRLGEGFFGVKVASASLIPLFAQRLLEGTSSQWINGGMLAAAAFASYSGIKDLIAYKRSSFKNFDAFLWHQSNEALKKDYQRV